MGKSLIQPPIKINFYYGRYLSSGCVMDGPAFTPWQDDGLWMPAAPCRGRSRTQHADTRVITALLATATKGEGGMLYTHTCTSLQPSFHTVLSQHQHKVRRVMKAGCRRMDEQTQGWIMRFVC